MLFNYCKNDDHLVFNGEGPLFNVLLSDESASVLSQRIVELFAQVETHYKSSIPV